MLVLLCSQTWETAKNMPLVIRSLMVKRVGLNIYVTSTAMLTVHIILKKSHLNASPPSLYT